MSADNWTTCPKCEKALAADKEKAAAKAREAYGQASVDVFLELRALAEEERPLPDTLREDYEMGIDGGYFDVSYRAGCTACDFVFNFKYSEKVQA